MKSYLKFLSRNKLYTAIEGIGLVVSLAFVILIGSYVYSQLELAYGNPDHNRIFVVSHEGLFGLGCFDNEILTAEIPEVETVGRFSQSSQDVIRIGDKTFSAMSCNMDSGMFGLFPLAIVEGRASDLDILGNAFVSRSFANRISSDGVDVIGTVVTDSEGDRHTIVGIVEDFRNSMFEYSDVIASMKVQESMFESMKYQSIGSITTYFRVREGTDRNDLSLKVDTAYKKYYDPEWIKPVLRDLDESVFHDGAYSIHHIDMSMMRMLLIVVLVLLICALFNYINLSFAISGKRIREFATRRLVGAEKSGIFADSILESVSFTAVCFVLAFLLAYLLQPMMTRMIYGSDLSGQSVSISLSAGSIALYIAVIALTGVLAGIFPAYSSAQFNPVDVVKGAFRFRSKRLFSKVFVVVQVALSIVLVSMALLMESELHHMLRVPRNSDTENLYFFRTGYQSRGREMIPLMDQLRALPEVEAVGYACGVPGSNQMYVVVRDSEGEPMFVNTIMCDPTAFGLINPVIVRDMGTPMVGSIWFSESTAENIPLRDTTEARIFRSFGNMNGSHMDHIGGTYKDFPSLGMTDILVYNSAFLVQETENLNWNTGLLLKTVDESKETERKILQVYKDFSESIGKEGSPSYNSYVSDVARQVMEPAIRTMRLVELFMALIVLLSVLGLIAMSTYYSEQKAKEIAVRKVFGGTVESETLSSVREYMVQVAIACIIALPVAVYISGKYLEQFVIRVENYWWVFALAIIITMIVCLLSVLWQTLHAAMADPARELKKE